MKRDEEKEIKIIEIIDRFKILKVSEIEVLAEFTGYKNCVKKLNELEKKGWLKSKKGSAVGGEKAYWVSYQGKREALGVRGSHEYEWGMTSEHELECGIVAAYLKLKFGAEVEEIKTDRELKKLAKKGEKKFHRPDLLYKGTAFELERSFKSSDRETVSLKQNKKTYERQIWITPRSKPRIEKTLRDAAAKENIIIEIWYFEDIMEVIKNFKDGIVPAKTEFDNELKSSKTEEKNQVKETYDEIKTDYDSMFTDLMNY